MQGQNFTSPVETAIADSFRRFSRYVQSAGSHDGAAELARADLRAAADEITRLACGLDLIKVVSSVRVGMTMQAAVRGTEWSAAILEVVAIVLACRDASSPAAVTAVPETEFMPPYIEAAAEEAMAVGKLMALFDTPPSDPDSAILFTSIQREILLRNPVYPHMLLETLRGLFDEPAVTDDCRAAMGFTGVEAVNVMEAVRSLSIEELGRRFERMGAARDASMPHRQAMGTHADAVEPELPEELREVMLEVIDALEELTTNIGRGTAIDLDAVAERTGYGQSTVEAVLDAFTLTGLTHVGEALERFFRGDNPLRSAPIVADTQGRRMLVHDGLALPAVREVIEARLKAADRTDAYHHRRGQWVENTAIDLLAGALPGTTVYRAFKYFVPDPNATNAQTDPDDYTKQVEGDGLILVDDVALIIEVKSVALTAKARGGVARRLRGTLQKILTDAADQAGRLRERIVADKLIRLDKGQWIDVSGVREIHTIAVGLEDLSGVTTATATLLAAGILNPDNIPWTVSIHDLRIVTELLDRPSELLLYLRRRTLAEATWKYRAVDELDLFLHFLNRGLYVEPDPHQRARALPWSGPPSVADLRRFNAQRPELVTSQTEPLDAWYQSRDDPDAPITEKPRFTASAEILNLVDEISRDQSPGWLPTAAALLEGNAKAQQTFARFATKLAKLVRHDRKHHSMTHLMGETSGKHFLLVWVCHAPDEDADTAFAQLTSYLAAKKHQTGAYRATCMLFDPTGQNLLRLIYNNQPLGPDPSLDAAAGLVPLDKMKRATSRGIPAPKT